MALAVEALFAASLGGIVAGSFQDKRYFYDFWNTWYSFPRQYTEIIDNMLITNSRVKVNHYELIGNSKTPLPNTLIYYYWKPINEITGWEKLWCWWYYISFEKVEKKVGDDTYHHYMAYVGPNMGDIFKHAQEQIRLTEPTIVRTISIDTAQPLPKPIFNKRYLHLHQFLGQARAIDHILGNYHEASHYNVKAIIHGPQGSGKSYTGYFLKKYMEQNDPNIIVQLVDNFNPSAVGVNIETFVLAHSKKECPIIIIVNEIDIIFREVAIERPEYDSRLCHTKNKQTFNEMLDSIASVPNVIFIGTTTSSIDELRGLHDDMNNHLRVGRFDMFLNMTRDTCTKINNI